MCNKIVQIIDDLRIDKGAPLNLKTDLIGGIRISNFSSVTAAISIESEAVYSLTKSAGQTYSKTLVKELSKFQNRIDSIAPGPMKTSLLREVSSNRVSRISVSQSIHQQQHLDSDVVKSEVSNDIS
jgi:short-subunit dehydrogenase